MPLSEGFLMNNKTLAGVAGHGTMAEADHGAAILVAQVVVLLIIVLTYFLSSRKWLQRLSVYAPASTFMILLGVVVGFIINQMSAERDSFEFNPEFFFQYLLPPIILGAGYTVRKNHFFHNFGSILLFAFVGTTLSAAFIGTMIYVVGQWAGVGEFDFVNSMVLGSLLSAVDPISIVVVLKSLGVDENLYVLIFGEAVLNDAVAIVINRVFVAIVEKEDTIGALPEAIWEIAYISVGSVLIGLVIGFAGALIHKRSRFCEFPHLEIGMFFLLAYMPYELAELLGLSGIMAILFAGIVADYYTSFSLSTDSGTTVREVIELISFVAESFVFVSLGMTVALFREHNFQIGVVAFALLWCLVGRVLSVFPLAAILNTKRKHPISLKYQAVMLMSGLRGPVAFALSMAVPVHRDVIVTTTLSIAIFTTVVFGGCAMPILTRLNLTGNEKDFTIEKFDEAHAQFAMQRGGKDGDGRDVNENDDDEAQTINGCHTRSPGAGFGADAEEEISVLDVAHPENAASIGLEPLTVGIPNAGSPHNAATDTRFFDESNHWFNRLHQKYLKHTFRARQQKFEHGRARCDTPFLTKSATHTPAAAASSRALAPTTTVPSTAQGVAFAETPSSSTPSGAGDNEGVELGSVQPTVAGRDEDV